MSLDDAFFDGTTSIGTLKLRPFSIGSMTACRKLGLTLFTGSEDSVSEEEVQRQIVAFAWIQTAPLDLVQSSIRNGTAQDQIDRFEFQLVPSDLKRLESEINRISRLAAAAAVEVVSKSVPADPDEPGNS
jgi:hypothetical protein